MFRFRFFLILKVKKKLRIGKRNKKLIAEINLSMNISELIKFNLANKNQIQ